MSALDLKDSLRAALGSLGASCRVADHLGLALPWPHFPLIRSKGRRETKGDLDAADTTAVHPR